MSDAFGEEVEWAGLFLRDLLEHWLEASATKLGIFYPYLDRHWRPKEPGPCILVSQCRLIYNFSRAYSLFSDSRFAEAALTGLQALESYFRLPSGGYRWSVSVDGEERDSSPDSYGH